MITKPIIYDQRPPSDVVIVGDSTPSFPVEFNRRLQAFDKDLYIVWHQPPFTRKPGRWKIEMCTRHHGGSREHSHLCHRVYVMMCQDNEGTPVPLGDWVLDKLREMRANSEMYGGQTERGLKNFILASNSIDQALEEKRESGRQDVIAHNRKFNRNQFNKLYDLIERHDMRPNR